MVALTISKKELSLKQLQQIYRSKVSLRLSQVSQKAMQQAQQAIAQAVNNHQPIYGVTTGFGYLANTEISPDQLSELQHRLILSHAAGTGSLLDDAIVRLIMVLKVHDLAKGHTGARVLLAEALCQLLAAEIYPCIPAKGSVGASGDLAPLAHLALALLGHGKVRHQHKIISAKKGLQIAGISPFKLKAAEGLGLINGTQVSTAIALAGLFNSQKLMNSAIISGCLASDAFRASHTPFDARIQKLRGHLGQIDIAAIYRDLLMGSAINQAHHNRFRVQDPYSFRAQSQVMGACLDQLRFASHILIREANAVTGNPLVFAKQGDILSGGNFHGEPVAMAADNMALAIAEIGALSERRIAMLMDANFSGLPAFLIAQSGLNSGFMSAQVTAASLVSENKMLAQPTSIDSLPTSANQEDHVSMSCHGARRLLAMTDNSATIIAIELMAACQGLDFHRPLKTSARLQKYYRLVRQVVPFYKTDKYIAPDIEKITTMVNKDVFHHAELLS